MVNYLLRFEIFHWSYWIRGGLEGLHHWEKGIFSTVDMPQASSTNRFSNFNQDRCVSTPQINVTGFIDDTYRDNRGTGLEERIRTRSKKGSNSIDVKLREDFTGLKMAVIEWGEIACSRAHTIDEINKKHNVLCAQIEHKISEVLLSRGDYSLVGELGSLKDRLNAVRKEAKQLARSLQPHEGTVPLGDGRTGDRSIRELSTRSYNAENVFFDSPDPEEQRSNSRREADMNLSRINLMDRNSNTDSVLVRGQEPMRVSSPAILSVPQVMNVSETLGVRGMDVSQSLTGLQANLPGLARIM